MDLDTRMNVQEVYFRVKSKSKPDEYHVTELSKWGLKCDCEAFHFTKTCSHVRDIKDQAGDIIIKMLEYVVEFREGQGKES